MGPKKKQPATPSQSDRGTRKRLTANSLAGLKSRGEPYQINDPECPNLQLHVAAQLADADKSNGTLSWHYRIRWAGKRVRVTLGQYPAMGIADAHEQARKVRELLAKGIDPRKAGITGRSKAPRAPAPNTAAGPKVAPNSIEQLTADFMALFIAGHRKDPAEVQRMLDKDVLSVWAGRDVRTIKPRDVIDLLDGIVARGSKKMCNRVHSLLTQLFKFAIHRDVIDVSPVQMLYRPGGEEKARDRALSDDELTALLARIDEVMARAPRTVALMRMALYTACRRSEFALARWSHFQLDGDAPVWSIPKELSKTEAPALVPLVPEAVALLRKLKLSAGRSPFLFPNGTADTVADPKILTRSLNRHLPALAKYKIKPFTLHDLRRTVRTGLARLEIPPHIAERVLNHKQAGVIAAYDTHSYAKEKRAALTAWAAHLETLRAQ